MNKNLSILIVLILVAGALYWAVKYLPSSNEVVYNPDIKVSDFSNSTTINNPYFSLIPSTKFQYEAKKADGTERNDVTVLSETRMVMGIPTVVVHDEVFLNGELKEDTSDWYAQDNAGNVWYFGEETAEYENGQVSTREGSWEAGKNGAMPGIIMQANPAIGQSYYQEYYKGEAEDRADILSLGETVNTPYGSFSNCIQTKDYTPLDPKAEEYKYYCKEVANVALEVDIEDNERVELVAITHGTASTVVPKKSPPSNFPSPTPPPTSSTPTEITEAQARSIATARVAGTVTDVAIETKFGKKTYVVEIKPSDGSDETDVVIDIQTGEVLAVEK